MTDRPAEPDDVVDSHAGHVLPDGYDVLPGTSSTTTAVTSRRGRFLAVGAGVVAVTLVAAGGVAVGLSLSGGGSQPEELVPADAVAYFDLDLDPSASQKVDAVRFFRHFPSMDSALGSGDDLRRFVAEAFAGSSVDYATQVQPWLGRRYAVAMVPTASGAPTFEAVLQVTDEAAARQDLPAVLGSGAGFTIADGFAVVSDSQATASALVDRANRGSLAQSAAFTSAMAPYGDGVASFYVDAHRLQTLTQGLVNGPGAMAGVGGLGSSPFVGAAQLTGPVAGVVKFEPDAVELLASAPTSEPAGPVSTLVDSLPDTTAVAVGAAGVGHRLEQEWDPLIRQLSALSGQSPAAQTRSLEASTGLRLPDDLVALLGSQFSLSVDSDGLSGYPLVGYQATTDPTTTGSATTAVTRLLRRSGVSLSTATTADGVVLATTPGYAQKLADGGGALGSSPSFRAAVPQASGATDVVYVDLATLVDLFGQLSGGSAKDLAPLKALGASVHTDQGRSTVQVRLTVTGG